MKPNSAAFRPLLGLVLFLVAGFPAAAQLSLGGAPGRGLQGAAARRGPALAPAMLRVNLGEVGQEADGTTDAAVLSDDGQWVAFSSIAANLLGTDGAGLRDVFLRNLATGQVVLVSKDASGHPANGASGATLDVSGDGRFVAFDSWASNLVAGDVPGTLDVFVFDRMTQGLSRVSVDSAGVAGDAASTDAAISADGRHVAFSSWATNLVGDDVNGLQDVFVHDLQTSVTWRVSEDDAGVGGIGASHSPDISATGQFIAYSTRANNLVTEPLSFYHYIFVHDAQSGETFHASKNSFGDFAAGESSTRPSITPDGRFVAFASDAYNVAFTDNNWGSDIFVHDRVTLLTTRVSVASSGAEASGGSIQPVLSADGTKIAFMSGAPDLVPDDGNAVSDVFVHDLITGTTHCISRGLDTGVGDAGSDAPTLSADGSLVLFGSQATDLVEGDGNGVRDVFLCEVP